MTAVTAEQLAAVLRARADWLDLPRDVLPPRPYITREQFRAAADMLDRHDALVAEVERLREALAEICDEFEDATYDKSDGTQSRHRKDLIARARVTIAKTESRP